MSSEKKPGFTGYQIFIIAVLTFIQFTVILDFMVLSPLSAILLKEMDINTDEFGLVVSAYAISAGISGFVAAGFADKFDRKKLLMFFYVGFVVGTALCGLANSYWTLLAARIFTGIFGGVIGSIAFAIVTDIFALEQRGRVMGYLQMAFAASQVLGLPIGLYLANRLNWQAPFWLIVGISIVAGILMFLYMRPVNEHLALQKESNAFKHLWNTLTTWRYMQGFGAAILLATGGYMLMPLGAAYSTANLGITTDDLPLVYLVTGIFTIFVGPFAGKLADRFGKINVFIGGSLIAMGMIGWYTNMGITPLWVLIAVNVILFMGLTARIIAAMALISAVPAPADRGAYMGLNSSIQQISGGVASYIAGLIVVKEPSGYLSNYPILGIVVMCSVVATILLFININRLVRPKTEPASPKGSEETASLEELTPATAE